MSLSVPSDSYPPCIEKTYTLPVAGSTDLTDEAGSTSPRNFLPSSISVNITTAGTFIFKGSNAVSNTINLAIGFYVLPFTFKSIEVGTAAGTVTAAWMPISSNK